MLSCFPNVKWDKLLWKAVERPNLVFSFKFNFRTSLGELNEGISPFADPLIYIPPGRPSIFCLSFAANHQLNKTSSALNSKLPNTKNVVILRNFPQRAFSSDPAERRALVPNPWSPAAGTMKNTFVGVLGCTTPGLGGPFFSFPSEELRAKL